MVFVAPSIESAVEGEWCESHGGRYFVATQRLAADRVHGLAPLSDLYRVPLDALSKLCREPAISQGEMASAVFVDTETTGLEQNAGTLVFLVGMLYFQDGEFHIRQYFMDGVAGEAAMLAAAAEFISDFSILVTFNGKSFDLPMLQMRLNMQNIPNKLDQLPHADLLFPARRLWKLRLGTCRLTALERLILGLHRTGDVAGAQIPEVYYRYLSDRDPAPLASVFYHNAQDLLTLLAITSEAGRRFDAPFEGRVQAGLDFLCLGKVYEALGDEDSALRAYDRALNLPMHTSARVEACKRITPLYKRRALMEHAVLLWEQMLADGDVHGVFPYKELAKYYEHDEQRYDRAEALLVQALNMLTRDSCTRTSRQELEKRLLRVRTKRSAHSS